MGGGWRLTRVAGSIYPEAREGARLQWGMLGITAAYPLPSGAPYLLGKCSSRGRRVAPQALWEGDERQEEEEQLQQLAGQQKQQQQPARN